MKPDICDICQRESNDLWLLNLAQIDSLKVVEGKNLRQSICQECVTDINQAVKSLVNHTSMGKALEKAGVRPNRNGSNNRNMNNSRGETQNNFLDRLIRDNQLVQMEAVEGIGWRGYIKKYDDFSLLISSEQTEEEELIFKHAVKSIKPI